MGGLSGTQKRRGNEGDDMKRGVWEMGGDNTHEKGGGGAD